MRVPNPQPVRGVRGHIQRPALRRGGLQWLQRVLQAQRAARAHVQVPGCCWGWGLYGGQSAQEPVPGVPAEEVSRVRHE